MKERTFSEQELLIRSQALARRDLAPDPDVTEEAPPSAEERRRLALRDELYMRLVLRNSGKGKPPYQMQALLDFAWLAALVAYPLEGADVELTEDGAADHGEGG